MVRLEEGGHHLNQVTKFSITNTGGPQSIDRFAESDVNEQTYNRTT